MHALRQFIQERMDARGWRPADLVRASGLTKQHVQQLLDDNREQMASSPKPATVSGLAQAFSVPESVVMAAAFEAMGYDLGVVRSHTDLSAVPSVELLRALGDRLGVTDEQQEDDRGNIAATSRAPGSGATVHDLQEAAHRGTPATEDYRKFRTEQERALGEESQDEGDA